MKKLSLLAMVALTLLARGALADSLKVAVPQKGNWDTGFVDYAIRQGFFKPENLDVETIYTQGGSQTIQAVISGSVDLAVGTGTLGIVGAFSKGAPMRIISAEMTGASDLFWMVRPDSPIHTLKDVGGHSIAYSEAGSSSNLVLLALLHQAGVTNAKTVAVGGVPNSLTQLMSGQIDVGWSAVPLNLQAVNEGKLRIVGRGGDAQVFQNETVRVNFTTASVAENKKDALERFNRVYVKAINWAYSDPKAIDYLMEGTGVSREVAEQTIRDYLPKTAMQPYEVRGLDQILQQAADFKFTPRLMTKAEMAPLLANMIKPEGSSK